MSSEERSSSGEAQEAQSDELSGSNGESGDYQYELCGGSTDELTLTSDSHPHGVNWVVCPDCSG